MQRTFLLGLVAIAACSSAAPPPVSISNTAVTAAPVEATPHLVDGALWTCQISDYDPQPCKLSRAGAGWRIAKLLGSQRFRGSIAFVDQRAHFVGEYFCPWGDCTAALDEWLVPDGGGYVTEINTPREFDPPLIRLHYDRDDAAAFAGAGYGGLTGDEQ